MIFLLRERLKTQCGDGVATTFSSWAAYGSPVGIAETLLSATGRGS